jgi:hypothetical protein
MLTVGKVNRRSNTRLPLKISDNQHIVFCIGGDDGYSIKRPRAQGA